MPGANRESLVSVRLMRSSSCGAAVDVWGKLVWPVVTPSSAAGSPECAWLRKYAVTAGDTLRKPSTVNVVPGMTLCGGSLSMLPLRGQCPEDGAAHTPAALTLACSRDRARLAKPLRSPQEPCADRLRTSRRIEWLLLQLSMLLITQHAQHALRSCACALSTFQPSQRPAVTGTTYLAP